MSRPYFATKYSSARDEVIAFLSRDVSDQDGNVEAPTGYFVKMTITPDTTLMDDELLLMDELDVWRHQIYGHFLKYTRDDCTGEDLVVLAYAYHTN